MSMKPTCFGYADTLEKYMPKGVKRGDCKGCGDLRPCIVEEKQRTYREWQAEGEEPVEDELEIIEEDEAVEDDLVPVEDDEEEA